MQHAIYKYALPGYPTKGVIVAMPANALILSVQAQHSDIAIWAIVNIEAPTMTARAFNVFPTGYVFGADEVSGSYVATVQFNGGSYVLHVFETQG